LAAGDYPIFGEINGVRTQSNAFITLPAAPAPAITAVGQDIANVSIFSPSTTLKASILRVTDKAITARLEIVSSGTAGSRSLTVRGGIWIVAPAKTENLLLPSSNPATDSETAWQLRWERNRKHDSVTISELSVPMLRAS
jgi:hypothetical protein